MNGLYPFLFGISGGEILILLLLVLLLFGPKKIPEIARMIGRGMNEVKKVQREINTEIHRYSQDIETEAKDMENAIRDSYPGVSEKSAEEQAPGGLPDAGESKSDTYGDNVEKTTDKSKGGDAGNQNLNKDDPAQNNQSGADDEGLPYPYNRDDQK